MVVGDRDRLAAVVVRVHVPVVEVTHAVIRGVVPSHVAVLRARVQLVPNHIPGHGQIRDGPMIDLAQGSFVFLSNF